jgi:hypothetical protein
LKIITEELNTEVVSSMYPENIRGIILKEHSWIAGLSAFTDMKEPEELQTSRVTRNVPLSEGEATIVSGELRAEKRTNNKISALLFIASILPLIQTLVNIKL